MNTEQNTPDICNMDYKSGFLKEELYINNIYTRFVKSKTNKPKKDDETIPAVSISKIHTEDFLKSLNRFFGKSNIDQYILPANCRYIKEYQEGSQLFVIEEPPQLRTVLFDELITNEIERFKLSGQIKDFMLEKFIEVNKTPPYKVRLAFPYLIYFIDIENNYLRSFNIFYRLHPLTSKKDYLLATNLPNVSLDGKVCMGDYQKGLKNPTELCSELISRFWGNTFNRDILSSVNSYENVPELSSFLIWRYYSLKDPMFIYDIPWKKHIRNFDEEINHDRFEKQHIANGINNLFNLANYETKRNETTYYDSLESVCLSAGDKSLFLTIGDKFTLDGKTFYLYSLKNQNYKNESMICEDSDGNLVEFSLDEKIKKQLSQQIKDININIDQIEYNNQIFKKGDLIKITNPLVKVKRIDGIRKCRDGLVEIKSGKTNYFLTDSLLVGIEKFDPSELLFSNGNKVIIGKEYFVSKSRAYYNRPIVEIKKLELLDFDINDENIKYKFSGMSIDENGYNIDDPDKYNLTKPSLLRIGDVLHTNHTVNDNTCIFYKNSEDKKLYKIIDHTDIFSDRFNCVFSLEFFLNNIFVNDEKNEIFIPGNNFDTHFKIGDEVIVADNCEMPISEITKIRKISGFYYSEEERTFNIITISDSGDELIVPFLLVSRDKDYCHINYGIIRHVVRELGELKVGTKIKLKEKGFFGFKKMDVLEVKAIIVDFEDIPLVLCSNGLTFWYNQDSFDKLIFIKPEDKIYNKLKITDNPTHYISSLIQSGDIVVTNNNSKYKTKYIIFTSGSNLKSRISQYDILYRGGSSSFSKTYSNKVFWGIPRPRISKAADLRNVNAIPFLNGEFEVSSTGEGYNFLIEIPNKTSKESE